MTATRTIAVAALAMCLSTCRGGAASSTAPTVSNVGATSGSNETVVLVGAGDIAVCGWGHAAQTAAILDSIPGTVFTAGDNSNHNGTADDFTNCYDTTWGRHKSRTRPAPGNHDYLTAGAAPYFDYFGARAGIAGLGYYSYTLSNWQVFSLNSNVPAGSGSPQYAWLEGELRRTSADCRLAYWHYPVFNSGYQGNMREMREVWRLLHEFGADVVVAGHAHDYERFAPMDAEGTADPVRGIREFVVGTGGAGFTELTQLQSNSEVFDNKTIGVLKLTLEPASYQWEFIPAAGGHFTDRGSGTCTR